MSKNQRTDGPVLDATSLNALSQAIKSREPAVERKEAMRSRILLCSETLPHRIRPAAAPIDPDRAAKDGMVELRTIDACAVQVCSR